MTMKKIWIFCMVCVLWTVPLHARDFIVEFIEENYKETQAQFSYDPLIYHSIQVNSSAGSKILILTGDDYNYRKWVRHFIAEEKKFITKIEDERIDEFIAAKAFEIDVTRLHPFNSLKWHPAVEEDMPDGPEILGNNNILIVDPNGKRTRLVSDIVEEIGYDAVVFSSAGKALEIFVLQPEKFKMIIVHHTIGDMMPEDFVFEVTQADHTMPVIIDVGYNNQTAANEMEAVFGSAQTVHLKSVILRELPKTIRSLMKESASS